MGFRLRKRIKIAPGINLNLGKRGASVSIGGKGATVNVGKKGVRTTVGIPGTGLSYTTKNLSKSQHSQELSGEFTEDGSRGVGILLFAGILFMPYIFSWLLLRSGHSVLSRILGFAWLFIFIMPFVTKQ